MRLLVITDTHISAGRPVGRLGDYTADVDAKLTEVVEIARDIDASALLCAGDVFHHPAPALSAIDRFLTFLERLDRRFVTIPGSHDLIGNNLDALPRTAIGLLARLGKIELLSSATALVVEVEGITVGIAGTECDIELTHSSVLPYSDFGEYTLLHDYRTSAKIVVVGHVHGGYDLTKANGVEYVCPGSLVRTAAQQSELVRRPRVAIIHDNFSVEWRELKSARPGSEVLSPPVVSPQIDFTNVIRGWSSIDIGQVDSVALLREIAVQERISSEAVEYTLRMLREEAER
jgi:predicted phosphodiesterase